MLTIALIEPRIPQNTGNITRLCACIGAGLYLVGDLGFRLDDKAHDKYLDKEAKRAAMDYREHVSVKHVPNFEAVLADKPDHTVWFVETGAQQLHTDVQFTPNTILVFGSETTGLPRSILTTEAERCISIPMLPKRRSLNLSNAVAVVAYEVVRQTGLPAQA